MQRIRVLIVEDEWIVSEEIKELLEQRGFMVSGQVEDGKSALEAVNKQPIDVALLDINIKGDMDGIELARKILEVQNCAIIFLTAFDDDHFISRAKSIKPAAYIVKPYQAKNLEMAVEMAFNNLAETNSSSENTYLISDHIFLKENHRFKKVPIESILYAEAVGSYTDIYFQDHSSTLAINLKAFENAVKDPRFFRIHRSFLVNLTHVTEYEGNRVFINQKSLPISAANKEEFLDRFRFI